MSYLDMGRLPGPASPTTFMIVSLDANQKSDCIAWLREAVDQEGTDAGL